MANDAFYRAEADYWRAEGARLKEILERIHDKAGERHGNSDPPEPPIGTRYFYGSIAAWERTPNGWVCAVSDCSLCPVDWSEAWEFGISRSAVRVLPDD
jgi:hypothetical protein